MEEEGRPHSQQRRAHGGHALGGDGAHLVKYGKYSQYSKHSKRSQCCRCSGHTLRSEAARARVSGGEGVGGEGVGGEGVGGEGGLTVRTMASGSARASASAMRTEKEGHARRRAKGSCSRSAMMTGMQPAAMAS